MDDFDTILWQARRLVGISRAIAADVFPNGARVSCTGCSHSFRASASECARYLSVGWPEHCGHTMSAEASE